MLWFMRLDFRPLLVSLPCLLHLASFPTLAMLFLVSRPPIAVSFAFRMMVFHPPTAVSCALRLMSSPLCRSRKFCRRIEC